MLFRLVKQISSVSQSKDQLSIGCYHILGQIDTRIKSKATDSYIDDKVIRKYKVLTKPIFKSYLLLYHHTLYKRNTIIGVNVYENPLGQNQGCIVGCNSIYILSYVSATF